jgi:hypothetical protein
MSDQKPIDETGTEAKAEAAADAKTIDAEPSAAGKARIFPLALHKPSPQARRFALLAASLALAAGLGGLIGSLSTYGLAAPKPDPEPAHNLEAALSKVTKDVGALKASIDAASRAATAQMAKLNERFDRSERAQAEPAAKIAALTDTVAKLEKRLAANADASRSDVTGSIPARAAATPAKDASKPPIVEGWVLRDVQRGRALLEHRDTLYMIARGADLPGVGRVEDITRQDGRWVVVTPKGLIVSMR